MDWVKATARRDAKHLSFGFGVAYVRDFMVVNIMAAEVLATQLVRASAVTLLT